VQYQELNSLGEKDLRKLLTEKRTDLFQAKMKNKLNQSTNPMEIRAGRKDIARILTALNVRQGKKG
jgi:large subunit ribosomal protein L29